MTQASEERKQTMPTYNVTIPCTMAVCVTVEAEDQDDALEAAYGVEWSVTLEPHDDAAKAAAPEVIEVETHRQIVHGNVYHGCINEPCVDEA